VVLLTSAAVGCYMLHLLFGLIQWGAISSVGSGSVALVGIQSIWDASSRLLLLAVAALCACGFGISTYSLKARSNIIALVVWALFACAYAAGTAIRVLQYDDARPGSDVSAWPAVLGIVLLLTYAGWLALRARRTITTEMRTDKRAILFRLACTLTAYVLVGPLVGLAEAAAPAYARTQARVATDCVITTAVLAALLTLLWPSHARGAFRVYDGTQSSMLLSELDGDALHHYFPAVGDGSEMDAAYRALKLEEAGSGGAQFGLAAGFSPYLAPIVAASPASALPAQLGVNSAVGGIPTDGSYYKQ